MRILLFTALLLYSGDLLAQLERQRVVTDTPVELTFMAPRNINTYTVEPLSRGELHYSIMHTFGEVKTGAGTLWGIDSGANVRFSLEYGFTDRISAGVGRSSLDKVYDLTVRTSLLQQRSSGGSPVSVSLIPTFGIITASFGFLQNDYSLEDRLHYSVSLPVARKFTNRISLQVTPMVAGFNRTGPELNIADPNVSTYITVAAGGRVKFSPRSAFTFQYVPPLTDARNLNPNIAIGVDIETGGHVFQMFFTTSRALNESYLIAGENGSFTDREFRFGFNVNRLFRVR
ncbi:MAG: hypothetical protein EA360_02425 [Balneolaceae bacterium]|nr:MAG: hypothetical protein EA360_02425 [Balneolaceae bacterium]